MNIQVVNPDDPRLALGHAAAAAAEQLAAAQAACGCCDGATCAACAPLAATHARLAADYQALYAPVVLTADSAAWWRLPVADWAWRGDAADVER